MSIKGNTSSVSEHIENMIFDEARSLHAELGNFLECRGKGSVALSDNLSAILKLRVFDTYINETRYFVMMNNKVDAIANLDTISSFIQAD